MNYYIFIKETIKVLTMLGIGILVGQWIYITYNSTTYWNECNRTNKAQYQAEVLDSLQESIKTR